MANSRHRKIDPNFDSPLLFPLPIGFGIMNALPLRSASSASPLPLPFPSLQFLARFKAQLIPSFFVQLSCLFFAHMGAADGSSQETLFPHLAPVSAPKNARSYHFLLPKQTSYSRITLWKKFSPPHPIFLPHPLGPRAWPYSI